MRVLGLFAKLPVAGRAKTRLASSTSPEFAARVADAFLRDTLARLTRLEVHRVVAFTPDDARADFVTLVGGAFALVPQGDGDLGVRLDRFFRAQFDGGALTVVVVGADSPTLPVEHVETAFRELQTADIVLGPATDGGYYLVGCARRAPPIFTGIDWSSNHVLEQTVTAMPVGCRLALLPPWYDVDTLDDWQMLRGHVAALRRAGLGPDVPNTERLVFDPMSPP